MAAAVPENIRAKMVQNIALKRFGTPENVADLVLFLASDRAQYITGAEIEVDGKIVL